MRSKPFFLLILSFPIVASSPITNNFNFRYFFNSSINFSAVKFLIESSKSIDIIFFIPKPLINFSLVSISYMDLTVLLFITSFGDFLNVITIDSNSE